MTVRLSRARAAQVDLAKCAHSRIGSDVGGGISGGERRRLSIGVEVVHKPRLLLLVRSRARCFFA
jgi:ATP-binding cassette subfamily G (WHITE) protein 2